MRDVVVAVVQKDLKFAFLQRASGVWTFPSGKVDVGEDFRSAARREVLEETGLSVDTPIHMGMRNLDDNSLHYYLCDWMGGDLTVAEPDKFTQALWLPPEGIFERMREGQMFPPVGDYLRRMQEKATCTPC